MKKIYYFFEILFYQFNKIKLIGQAEDNNAHFAAMIFSLLMSLNILSALLILDKIKIISDFYGNAYFIWILFLLMYFAVYLLFVRNNKHKYINEKYRKYKNIKKTRRFILNQYLIFYLSFTLIFLILSFMITSVALFLKKVF